MSAAVRGHTAAVRALLDKGADANAKGNAGRTALMEAAFEGYTETVRALLQKGADVNMRDEAGWTALFWAAFSRRADTVRVLLKNGADVNAKNNHDETALIHAAYGGDTDTLVTLLEEKADVNAKDDMGRTALMVAARQGQTNTVRVLLEKGAAVDVRDRGGDTALSAAEKQNYSDVVALFKSPAGRESISKSEERGVPSVANAAAGKDSPVAPDKQSQAEASYRTGLNMEMMEVWWPQSGPLAAHCASRIRDDLRSLGAPSDLVELANQSYVQLSAPLEERKSADPALLRELRTRLGKFYASQAEREFFYAAGGFTHDLSLLGEDVKNPATPGANIESHRRQSLPIANSLVERCSMTVGCKEQALVYFLAAETVLKRSQLIPADGAVLVKVSGDLERVLGGNER